MHEEEDTLFSGRGELPADLARLRDRVAGLPLPPEPDWDRRRPRERHARVWWLAAAAALVVVAAGGGWLVRDAWRVESLAGAPTFRGFAYAGRLGLGGALATDRGSSARVLVPGLGDVRLEPGSLLRRVPGRREERRLALDRGTMHATITAPPRVFVVETPSCVATDLGCAYTLHVGEDGNGWLSVTDGRVAFADRGRESFVPAGVSCRLSAAGVGLPRRDFASDAFAAALAGYEQPDCATSALDSVLAAAEASDAITLWHLLPRVPPAERERVARRMDALIEVPANIPLAAVLALEPAALDAWWEAIGMGTAREWRAGKPGKHFSP